ncbi:unnamed protein product [Lactuca saligna]|uniref:Uncharacterized protein n=1 Tax=Lactuca saligna TaxID=75948 RepID=A0AA35YCN8_LACSI|nr:unnamed protein product [Lactuca saligna]
MSLFPTLISETDSVPCSLMSSSKVQLVSSWKGREKGLTSVVVVVSDIAYVDGRIWKRSVIKSQDNCLGLHVVATDSSNVQLLNKLYTYALYKAAKTASISTGAYSRRGLCKSQNIERWSLYLQLLVLLLNL